MKVALLAVVSVLLLSAQSVAEKAEIDVDATAQQAEVQTKEPVQSKKEKVDDKPGSATLEAIDGELLETEALIAAQEKKVNLLQVLRREYLSGKRGGVSLGKSLAELEAASLKFASPGAGAIGSAVESTDFLVPRVAVNTSDITALSVLEFKTKNSKDAKNSKARRAPASMNVIVTGHKDGSLIFYDSLSGEEIHTEKAELVGKNAYVTSIAFEGADSPFLVVGGSDGSFAILRISLWRDDLVIAGKAPQGTPDPDHIEGETDDDGKPIRKRVIPFEPPVAEAPSGYAMVIRLASTQDPTGDDSGTDGSKAILAVEIYSRQRKKLVIAGSANGNIYVHQVNGTHLKTFETSGPVVSLRRSGAMLAYNAGANVNFILLSRLTESGTVCQGAMSVVTGLLFDTISSSVLYAATASGDVFVFNTKYKASEQQRGGSTTCRMTHTIRANEPMAEGEESPFAIPLVGLKGYTVVGTHGTTPSITVHNVTTVPSHSRHQFLFDVDASPQDVDASPQAERVFVQAAGVMGRGGIPIVVVASSSGAGTMTVYER
jgi:hypothetical protein